MGKEKRYRNFSVFVRGSAVTIGVYLVIVAVAALLVVKGIVPEKTKEGMIAGAGFVAALAGGRTVVGQGGLGTLLPAVLNAAIFVGVLIAVKLIGGTPGNRGSRGMILYVYVLCWCIGLDGDVGLAGFLGCDLAGLADGCDGLVAG